MEALTAWVAHLPLFSVDPVVPFSSFSWCWWPCDEGASNLVVVAGFLFIFRVFVVFLVGSFGPLFCICFSLLGLYLV